MIFHHDEATVHKYSRKQFIAGVAINKPLNKIKFSLNLIISNKE
jgi:hypothetical protein